jgi:hypothetical protein
MEHKMDIEKMIRGLLVLVAITMGGCAQKLELPSVGERKIVLLGELVADDNIFLRAGQSSPVKAGASYNREVVKGLSIVITDEAGVSHSLLGVEDDISLTEYTLAYSSSNAIEAGMSYEVKAHHEKMETATVSVPVPKAFNASVRDTQAVVYNGEQCLKLNVDISDNGEKNYYSIEVVQQQFTIEEAFLFQGSWIKKSEHSLTYDSLINAGVNVPEKMDSFYIRTFNRVSVYTEDNVSEHLLTGKGNQLARRVLINDHSFNGRNHSSILYIPRNSLGPQNPGMGLRTLVQVKSISEGYFKYLQAYEQYDPFGALFNTNTTTQIPGNIINGVGVIGGVFKREFVYYL